MIGTNGNSSSSSYGGASERRAGLRDDTLAMRSYQAREANRSSGWPWAITGIALAFAAGLLASPWFETKVRGHLPAPFRQAGANTADVSALDERLAVLEARLAASGAQDPASIQAVLDRLAALEARSGTVAAPAGADTSGVLAERMAALESRINTLDQTVSATAAQAQTVQTAHSMLDGRFLQFSTQVESRLGELKVESDRARTLVVVAAARRALAGGQPIGGAVDTLAKAYGADNPNVAALRAVANGAPTPESLRQRFNALKPSLLTAGQQATGGNWFDRVTTNLKGMVQVRRADTPATPGDPISALDAIDQRLARGDLNGALAAGRALPPAMRAKAQPLLTDIQALIAARQALTRLETAALAG